MRWPSTEFFDVPKKNIRLDAYWELEIEYDI